MKNEGILFFTFLGIFIVTAAMTLLSLPGWIKVPDHFKKKLFATLILEVVASILLLFKIYFLDQNFEKECKKLFKEYALIDFKTGKLFMASLPDNTIKLNDEEKRDIEMHEYILREDKDEKYFKVILGQGEDGDIYGRIPLHSIEDVGLFNNFFIKDNVDDIAIIEFFPFSPSKSKKNQQKLKRFPFFLEVNSEPEGVYYRCYKKNKNGKEEDIIEKTEAGTFERKPIIYKDQDCFYFIYIILADFDSQKEDDKKIVQFIIIKFTAKTSFDEK